jgi:hypothetical protein
LFIEVVKKECISQLFLNQDGFTDNKWFLVDILYGIESFHTKSLLGVGLHLWLCLHFDQPPAGPRVRAPYGPKFMYKKTGSRQALATLTFSVIVMERVKVNFKAIVINSDCELFLFSVLVLGLPLIHQIISLY